MNTQIQNKGEENKRANQLYVRFPGGRGATVQRKDVFNKVTNEDLGNGRLIAAAPELLPPAYKVMIPITTPLNTRQALARILPDVIHYDEDGTFGATKYKGMGLMWIDEQRPVRDTELRHLVDLAEAKLTEEQHIDFQRHLWSIVTDNNGMQFCDLNTPAHYRRAYVSATTNQRVLALTRVHGTEEQV